jgi:hypothetical protein
MTNYNHKTEITMNRMILAGLALGILTLGALAGPASAHYYGRYFGPRYAYAPRYYYPPRFCYPAPYYRYYYVVPGAPIGQPLFAQLPPGGPGVATQPPVQNPGVVPATNPNPGATPPVTQNPGAVAPTTPMPGATPPVETPVQPMPTTPPTTPIQ